MNEDLNQDIRYLKGVGEKSAENLASLSIYNFKDLLEYFPRNYEDRTKLKKIKDFVIDENVVFIAKVVTKINVARIRKNLVIYSFFVEDESLNRVQISVFNQNYIRNKIKLGEEYAFYGKAEGSLLRLEVQNPVIVDKCKMKDIMGIYPIYTLTKKITNNYLVKIIKNLFEKNIQFEELFSEKFLKEYNLLEINDAIKNIHKPKSFKDLEKARRRLIFEELFLLQLALNKLKYKKEISKREEYCKDIDYTEFQKIIPFELTYAQIKSVDEILKNMGSEHPMNRLLQGDVRKWKDNSCSYCYVCFL